MSEQDESVLIYTTFANAADAGKVGHALVKSRLAACVNILPRMTAIYEWQGELHEDAEAVMIIKTRKGCLGEALARAKELHPYETPALVVLDPLEVDPDFAAWIAAQTETRG